MAFTCCMAGDLFMGLQSFLFYSSIAWFPDILTSHGMNLSTAGWMLSIMQFVGPPSTFLTPVLAEKLKTQRPLVAGLVLVYLLGMIGLLLGGSTPILVISVLLIGIGQGASISLALTFIGLRTTNMEQAVRPLWNGAVSRLFIRRCWAVHDWNPF